MVACCGDGADTRRVISPDAPPLPDLSRYGSDGARLLDPRLGGSDGGARVLTRERRIVSPSSISCSSELDPDPADSDPLLTTSEMAGDDRRGAGWTLRNG